LRRNLVTGGAGFIGSNLIEHLINNGEKVICLDNFSTSNGRNIKKWSNNDKFSLINQDVVKPISIEIDRIWHLASPASPIKYIQDPITTSKVNFIGTDNMLKLATKNGARIMLASTSEIYGDPKVQPQSERYFGNVNNLNERSCYVEGKRIAETLCFDYKRTFGTDIRIIRIFNTYGPGMEVKDGRVISNFINQALNNEPLTIFGSGDQTRSFCYIKDLIKGMISVMENSCEEPLNIGNEEELSIKNLAELIKNKINKELDIIFLERRIDDPFRRRPQITLAKDLLGWEPLIPLEVGLEETIKYFRSINLK
jgi:UDP-glucuronate decarboxylase